ncbi:hypothetical protein [uncultured Flavobacterium sp.]|mgnify:CR=1 FL=1|uniref:hypothetical protein n=1 Tax=uncultured Flavobacterium sp. TaxID=165435 RepID=UPI0030CA4F5D|tara:strand:+ start:437 stop:616 length:180 start_codon:yes stop_codon:yes gene_type:complete
MKNNVFIVGSILIVFLFVVVFIHFSNDHKECETVVNTLTYSNGTVVKTEEHICKEIYNF